MGRHVAYLQPCVEDFSEHWGQLSSAVLHGGRGDRVRAGRFAEVLFFLKSAHVPL